MSYYGIDPTQSDYAQNWLSDIGVFIYMTLIQDGPDVDKQSAIRLYRELGGILPMDVEDEVTEAEESYGTTSQLSQTVLMFLYDHLTLGGDTYEYYPEEVYRAIGEVLLRLYPLAVFPEITQTTIGHLQNLLEDIDRITPLDFSPEDNALNIIEEINQLDQILDSSWNNK